jgi:hypothetical protein
MTMDNVCSFIEEVQLIPNKLQRLSDVIADILKQTVECAISVGFTGSKIHMVILLFYV